MTTLFLVFVKSTQGNGLMPDKTSMQVRLPWKTIYHFMGTSIFSEMPELSVANASHKNSYVNVTCNMYLRYWLELNLVVGPQITIIVKIYYGGFRFGSLVRAFVAEKYM